VVYYERYAFFHFAGVLLARLYGRPVMVEVNEVAGIERARRLVLVRLARWIERLVLRRADVVLVVSSYLKDEVVARGARAANVHVMPNAVDAHWLEARSDGSRVRRERGLDSTFVIGFVGWFDRWDRLDVLVDALAELLPKYDRLGLLLVGSGPAVEDLERSLEQRRLTRAVTLTGPVPRNEVRDYIDAMDICVLADSNPFGSPIVMFEFMARAKPVVAPALRPMLDGIEHGRTGWLFKPADRRALVRAIEALVERDEMRGFLGRNAREKVRRDHTWQANGRRVAELAAELHAAGPAA
jgi:glycosyltransferase involved in cell wall biosynthesis